jgi:hypothetical protein
MPVETTAMVSLADPLHCLEVRAREVSPLIAVVPPILRWSTTMQGALSADRCARLRTPLCIVRTETREDHRNALLLTHAEVVSREEVRNAADWCDRITAAGVTDCRPGSRAEPEVAFLSKDSDAIDLISRIDKSPVDVLAVQMRMFDAAHLFDKLNIIMSLLLSRSAKTVLPLAALSESGTA